MGNLTLLSVNCCKEESDVLHNGKRDDEKAAQTCVVRWSAVPALAPAYRTLPAPPPTAVPLPRSVSQATTLPGLF
jgi:hypothetical protein